MDADSLDILHILATEFMPVLALWGALDRLVFAKMRASTSDILSKIKDLETQLAAKNVNDALIAQRVEYLEKTQK